MKEWQVKVQGGKGRIENFAVFPSAVLHIEILYKSQTILSLTDYQNRGLGSTYSGFTTRSSNVYQQRIERLDPPSAAILPRNILLVAVSEPGMTYPIHGWRFLLNNLRFTFYRHAACALKPYKNAVSMLLTVLHHPPPLSLLKDLQLYITSNKSQSEAF